MQRTSQRAAHTRPGAKEGGVPDHEAAAMLGHDTATYARFYLVTDDAGAAAAVAGTLFAAR